MDSATGSFVCGLLLMQMQLIYASCILPVDKISCKCSDNTLQCMGSQTENTDLISAIVNSSFVHFSSVNLEHVLINIGNLSLNSSSTFKDMTFKNLSLSSGLMTLDDDLFIGLSSFLLQLDLQNNSFDHIPANALQILHSLEHLDMSYNLIASLSKADFDGLKNLKNLHLEHNQIETIEGEAFYHLLNLEELYLDFNYLRKLGITVFDNLDKLQFLSMSSNNFQAFEPETFTELSSLRKLIIDHNNFSFLGNINFSSVSLVELSAINCSLQGPVQKNDLQFLANLEFLDLSFNHLTLFETFSFTFLENLKVLKVSNNPVRELKDHAFANLFNLRELNLESNALFVIRTKAFSNLTKLLNLDLSKNKLGAFLCEYTSELSALEVIDLQDNRLKTIRAGTFLYSPQLKRIIMNGNILDCTCLASDFAGYLLNSTTLDKTDISSITCSTPPNLSGLPLINVNFDAMKCSTSNICEPPTVEDEDYVYEDESIAGTTDVSLSISTSEISTLASSLSQTTSSQTSSLSQTTTGQTSSLSETTSSQTSLFSEPATSVFSELETASITSSSTGNTFVASTPIFLPSETTTLTPSVSETENLSSAVSETSTSISESLETEKSITTEILYINETSSTKNDSLYSSSTKNDSSISSLATASVSFITEELSMSTTLETSTDTSTAGIDVSTSTDKLKGHLEILIKNHSYVNDELCFEYMVNGVLPGEKMLCLLLYMYPNPSISSHHESQKKTRLRCPSNSNMVMQECNKIYNTDVLSQFCLQLFKSSTKELLINACQVNDEKLTTEPLRSVSESIEMTTNDSSTDETSHPSSLGTTETTNHSSSLLTTETTSNSSSFKTAETTNHSYSQTRTTPTTSISSIETTSRILKTPIESFNFTYMNLGFVNESSLVIDWKVNRREPYLVCRIMLKITSTNSTFTNLPFVCSDNSYTVTGLTKDTHYKVCLTAFHKTHGVIPICHNVYKQSYEFSMASSSADSSYLSLPMIVLISLLVVVILLVIVLAARTIARKPQVADRYNVSAEEKKVQKRENRQRSTSHSVRYSYTAKENLDVC